MRRILVVRHGQSAWNVERRWQGWEDAPLTPAGEAQAAARGRALHDAGVAPARVVSSDLRRAHRTAEILASQLGAEPPVASPGMRERHGGEWQGLTADEIEARYPGMRAAWRRGELAAPPGGETDASVYERVDGSIAGAVGSTPSAQTLVVVTHHGVLRLLSTRAGVPVDSIIPNLGGRWFGWVDEALHALDALGPLPDDDPVR